MRIAKFRPFRAQVSPFDAIPGRCPGLTCVCPIGATDNGAGVGARPLLEFDERSSDFDSVPRLRVQPGDLAVLRGRHLDDRFFGFHRNERLVGNDTICAL